MKMFVVNVENVFYTRNATFLCVNNTRNYSLVSENETKMHKNGNEA